jgi:hypothetical protein
MNMSSSGTFNAKNSTGKVASTTSTEAVTLSTSQPLIDFTKRFAEFSPLLMKGCSFPLHDDIDHDVLSYQSGIHSISFFDDFMNIVHPPLYLIRMWLFTFVYIPLVFAFYNSTDFTFVSTILGTSISLLILLVKIMVFGQFIFLLLKSFSLLTKTTLQPQMGAVKADPYLKEAIQVWCLFESLRDARTKRGMLAAITQYLQAHTKESLPLYLYRKAMSIDYITDWSSADGIDQIEEMLDEAFGSDNVDEANEELRILDAQGGDMPWHVAMDLAFSNWKDFRNSALANKFTHFINVIVSAGMCSTASLTFSLGCVPLFTPIVSKKQLAAGDVFEAFYEAVSGFMKGGWRVFQTGDLSTFFMDDDKIAEFDELYNQLRSWHGYALAGNLREYTDIDENEYDVRLSRAIELGETLLLGIKRTQTFERKYVSDRNDRLRDNQTEFVQLRTRGGLRISPFAVSLFGRSGCGKSSLTSLTINAGLIYNELSAEKDRIATWADNDKFASSVRSHINAIIFDDFANTKEDFLDFSPAYRLIQVINNIRYLAPMADVFLKGKVSLNPYFCLISTNIEDLHAAKYSNEPESVLRRMYHVKVVPKEEFCTSGTLDSSKIQARFGQTPCPDVWDLTVRRYKARNVRFVSLEAMENIWFEEKELKDISVTEYLRWVQIASKEHFANQNQYLENQEQTPVACPSCGMCYCSCPRAEEEVLETQAGNASPQSKVLYWSLFVVSYLATQDFLNACKSHFSGGGFARYYEYRAAEVKRSIDVATAVTCLCASAICERWNRYDFIPVWVVCHPKVLKFGLLFWASDLKRSLYTGNGTVGLVFAALCGQFPRYSWLWFIVMCQVMYFYTCITIQTYERMVRDRILDLRDVVKTFVNRWEFKYALIGLGAIALILAAMRSRYTKLDTQTGLDPQSIEEVNERNDKANPWLVASTKPLPMSEPSRTTTADNLAEAMRTNIVGIVSDQSKTTLGFYVTSNFMLIPTHFAIAHKKKDFSIKCYKTRWQKDSNVPDPNEFVGVGCSFRDKLSLSYSVQIPDTDFTLCYVTSGGSMKDMQKFFPKDSQLKQTAAKMVTRGVLDGSLKSIPTLFQGTTTVAHTLSSFLGSYYTLPIITASGMCMSPIISDGHGSTILGFHLGGKGKLGGCGTVTADQIAIALSSLSEIDGVVLSASSGQLTPNMGNFPDSTFGKKILESTNIHPKSAVNFLGEGAFIDVYGEVAGKATPYSRVEPTIISDSVAEVFGVPQQWGPPKMKGKGCYPYQATLVHAAVPSLPLGSVLAKAVGSIKSLSTDLKKKIPKLFDVGPLSRVATVSGLDGVKFIDPMNFNTSPGFPLKGTKHPLLVDLDPKLHPECSKPRTFIPEIWAEYDEIFEILKSGHRCYVIWKSCLKDEATKMTKNKVRVFQSAPLVLQLLIRKYFLPIVRIIQMNPILFECAVGVNAEGLEWQQLWEAAMSKGKERVLAGDYSKYDVRMPAQITIAAFDILIDIARKCDGYSAEDIHIMEMMVNEVVYPVMAFNGELIQLFGTNPSGQNLTVIINSIGNSLLLRCGFFTMYPDMDFKKNCSFLTYGDDVIGTISAACANFTHITYAAFLAEHDMKFTMPDKESTPTHYMKEEDVDFLKRKCVFNPDLGQKVGLLSEDSIYKRLHAHLLSKELTLEMHSAQNIESSLHDWFYYGREVFEDRRSKLKQISSDCEISHLCPALDISYDRRVNRWRHKYLGEELLEDTTNVNIE